MKSLFLISILTFNLLWGISIFDIQYTTEPGSSGTYPSPYEGQTVLTGGIVTGTDYNNGRFFISSSTGGSWNGLYIYDNNQNVAPGDSIIIQAEVFEYYGFTELKNPDFCSIINSGNAMPATVPVSTQQIDTQEALESVLVEVNDAFITQNYNSYGEWRISDGSGSCLVGTGFFNLEDLAFPLISGYPFSSLKGHVSYEWSEYKLNPRNLQDIQSAPQSYIISIPDHYQLTPQVFEMPVHLSFLGDLQTASAYDFVLHYNPAVLEYAGLDLEGTLSAAGTIQIDQPAAGLLSVEFSGVFSFSQIQTLLRINFVGVGSGSGNPEFSAFQIGAVDVNYFSLGDIVLQLESLPIGDTLTVIQKPLANIPAIVVPTAELNIECLADPATTGWNAKLQHQQKIIPLSLGNTSFNPDLQRWQLTAEIPQPDIYELYDLVVSAAGLETDTVRNCVKIIPIFKDSYYFVHVTDPHLPTRIYYPDPLSLADSTEIVSFREVIRDINLINPEFVLLTGDLVNEGEMEDFENRRVYTKAQKLLYEFEVPLYLTSGNHDIGGWPSSPPASGTARRNWWRFFGWNRLENPHPFEPYYTQNYSFDYGYLHFIGLEAYNNYDSFMYNIYGATSFTDQQMQWLAADLQQHAGSAAKVLFYHYDFDDQIDLIELGVDMALWGHNHYNSGSLNSQPYNLSTQSACNGNRTYRVIYVDNDVLQPTQTVAAGANSNNLQTVFSPANNGLADSVYCYLHNAHDLSFNEAQLKFIMPGEADDYSVYGGQIMQIDQSGEFAVCYVKVSIPANGAISVSMVAETQTKVEDQLLPELIQLTNFPNPFNPTTEIRFQISEVGVSQSAEIVIYNVKGQKIKTIRPSLCHPETIKGRGRFSVIWNGDDENSNPVASGIYLYKLVSGNKELAVNRMLLLK